MKTAFTEKSLKKSLLVLVTVIVALSVMCTLDSATSISAAATDSEEILATGSCGPNVNYTMYESGTLVLSGSGPMYDYDHFEKEKWSPLQLYLCDKIIIGDGITTIGNSAFYGTDVASVSIPDSVTRIGDSAFASCGFLTSVTIPKNVTEIGICAFSGCSSLKNVTIPEGVKTIGRQAFYYCKKLESIVIPDSVTEIGNFVCSGNENLKTVVIGNGIKEISHEAFSECPKLENVAFGNNVETIKYEAFYECTGLKNITLPESITTIGELSFRNCTALEEIIIPKNVSTVEVYAFDGCTALKSVTIPQSVTSIGTDAFKCSNLETVNISDLSAWFRIEFGSSHANPLANGAGLYLNGTLLTDITIPEEITIIPEYSLYGYQNLKSVIIGDNVNTIDSRVFYDCVNLENVTIGKNVTSSVYDVFYNCTGIKNVYAADAESWLNIKFEGYRSNPLHNGASLYFGGKLVTDLIIPEKTTEIKKNTFYGCTSIENVQINNELTTIETNAFYECINLKEIILPANVSYITNFSLPETLEKLTVYNPECRLDGVYTLSPEIEIVGYRGSTAEKAANAIQARFTPLDDIHVHSHKTVTDIPATCTEDGLYVAKCVCGDEIKTVREKTGHKEVTDKAIAATCTSTGLTEGKHCSLCGYVFKAQQTVAKKSHTYKNVTTKATLSKNGKTETKCTVCGHVSKSTSISAPKSITLSATSYAYNGKVKTPSVTVKNSKGTALKKDTDYTVSYEKGRKNPGQYTVTVTLKGKYSGTKKINFTIKPATTSKIIAAQNTTAIKLTWAKVTGATGYRVYRYNSKTKKYDAVKDVKNNTVTFSKLKPGTKYKYEVRAYTKDNGVIWGEYSKAFETATKPATPALKAISSKKGTATLSWQNVSGENGYEIFYSTKKDSGYKKLSSTKANVSKATVSKLASGKTYYFRVRAFTKTASGTVYSGYKTVAVKVK